MTPLIMWIAFCTTLTLFLLLTDVRW